MSLTVAELIAHVQITGSTEAEAQLNSMSGKVEKTSGGFKSMLGNALSFAAGQAAFRIVGDAIGFMRDQIADTIKITLDHQQIQAQTVAALKSTKDASGETTQSLQDLAEKFSSITPYSQDAVEGVENLELTFTNIHKNVFPQTTQAILDVSQAMHEDLKSASVEVGKALGDPAKGMTALQRIGVTFSQSQQDAVKHMLAVGNTAGAQKVILQELEKEFGGSAKAAGQTLGGQLDILKNHFDEVKEKIGTALIPVITGLVQKIAPVVTRFADWLASGNRLQNGINAVVQVIQNVIQFIGNLITIGQNLVAFFQKNETAMDALKAALLGVAVVIAIVVVSAFVAWAIAAGAAAIATIAATWPLIAIGAVVALVVFAIIEAVKHWGDIMNWIGSVMGAIGSWIGNQFQKLGTTLHLVITLIGQGFSGLGSLVKGIWDGIVGAVKGAINWIIGDINSFIGFIDSIQIHIPSVGVGPIHTPSFDWNGVGIPKIPLLAQGGTISGAGWATVGERGPENVYLPQGAQVYPNSSMNASGGQQTIVVQPPDVILDGIRLSRALLPHLNSAIRNGTGRMPHR